MIDVSPSILVLFEAESCHANCSHMAEPHALGSAFAERERSVCLLLSLFFILFLHALQFLKRQLLLPVTLRMLFRTHHSHDNKTERFDEPF